MVLDLTGQRGRVAVGPGSEGAARPMPAAEQPSQDAERRRRYAELVLPELPVLLRVAATLTSQPADAEDVVQDTLLRAWRALDTFDGRHPRAWLLTVLRHTEINRHRRQRPQLLTDPDKPAGWHLAVAAPSAGAGRARPRLRRGGRSRAARPAPPDAQGRPARRCSTNSATPKHRPCSAYRKAPSPAGCTGAENASTAASKPPASPHGDTDDRSTVAAAAHARRRRRHQLPGHPPRAATIPRRRNRPCRRGSDRWPPRRLPGLRPASPDLPHIKTSLRSGGTPPPADALDRLAAFTATMTAPTP